jgi:hypothetical protein
LRKHKESMVKDMTKLENLVFEKTIDDEPVFKGIINDKPFRVLFVRTDIDYGWHFLDYLPRVSATEAGTDQLSDDEYEDVLEHLEGFTIDTRYSVVKCREEAA